MTTLRHTSRLPLCLVFRARAAEHPGFPGWPFKPGNFGIVSYRNGLFIVVVLCPVSTQKTLVDLKPNLAALARSQGTGTKGTHAHARQCPFQTPNVILGGRTYRFACSILDVHSSRDATRGLMTQRHNIQLAHEISGIHLCYYGLLLDYNFHVNSSNLFLMHIAVILRFIVHHAIHPLFILISCQL